MDTSFSRNTVQVRPLAGTEVLPLEASDPPLAGSPESVQPGFRDPIEQGSPSGLGPGLISPHNEVRHRPHALNAGNVRKWSVAIFVSCTIHAAAAMALLSAPLAWKTSDDTIQIEGADQTGMMLVGNANEDQAMAGEITKVTLVSQAEPKPIKPVDAEPVPTEEHVQPVDKTAAQLPVSETVEPVPPILASIEQPATANIVIQQTNLDTAVEPIAKAATTSTATETPIEESIETPQLVDVVPIPRPTRQARSEPKETPERALLRKAEIGSGGASEADAKRGIANGKAEGEMLIASTGGATSSIGNAAVSNYPGKVAAKLRRVARTLSRAAQASAHNNAQVSFVVEAGGEVQSIRLVKSSGSPGLDEAALSIIQRAAPFPPIPPQAGRESWAFTLPIGPF